MTPDPNLSTVPDDASYVPLSLLGEVLIAARKESGLSQLALAERLGMLQEAVARWERERYRGASLERLVKVVQALGIVIELRQGAPVVRGKSR